MGVVTGLIVPVIGFFLYGVVYVTGIRPHLQLGEFVNDLFFGTREYQSPILSLSLVANLVPFFLFDRNDKYKAMRGVILSSFIYGLAIVVLWFL